MEDFENENNRVDFTPLKTKHIKEEEKAVSQELKQKMGSKDRKKIIEIQIIRIMKARKNENQRELAKECASSISAD